MNLLLAAANSEAEQAGRAVGAVIGVALMFGLLIFSAVAFIKAFTRRTPGWIVAGSIGGFILVGIGVSFTIGLMTGFLKARQRSAHLSSGAGDEASAAPAPATAQTIRGKDIPYQIILPPGWAVQNRSVNSFDLLAARQNLYTGVIAEEGTAGNSETLLDFAQTKLKGVSTDAHFSATSAVRIDGRDWLQFSVKCQVQKLPIAYLYHLYAGPEGSFQVVSWTLQNSYDRDAAAMQALAATFRFPAPAGSAAGAPPAALPPPPQTVKGRNLAYTLTAPADWTVKRANNAFDVEVFHRSLYVGVVVDEGSEGTPATALKRSQDHLRATATHLEFSEAEALKIDGRNWLHCTAKCQVENIPFVYQYYVYAGPEGSFRVIGWTMQNLYDRDADAMRAVALTFRFPPPAAAPSPAATPARLAIPTPQPKSR